MKKFIILAMAVMMSGLANAQIVASSSSRIQKEKVAKRDYNRIYLGYATVGFSASQGDDPKTLNGAKLGYLHGFSLTNSQPLYLEFGVESQFGIYQDKKDGEEITTNNLNFSVPVNLAYKYTIPNSKWYLEPYAGLSLRVHAIGNTKTEVNGRSSDVDWFDDDHYKRFQFGGEFGVNVGYKALNINLGYQLYGPLYKNDDYKIKTNTFTVGLGINF